MNFVETVEAIARKLRIEKYADMDSSSEFVEFFTLRSEIMKKIEKSDTTKVPMLYELAEVLCEINNLYTPVDAFIAGMITKTINKDYLIGYNEFCNEIDMKVQTSDLTEKRNKLLTEVKTALGKNCDLITKFTEQHTKNTSVEVSCLVMFYEHGYNTEIVKDDGNNAINRKLYIALQKENSLEILFKSKPGGPFGPEECF